MSATTLPAAVAMPARAPAPAAPRVASDRVDAVLDAVFGPRANPMRQLGALAYGLFWLVALTGLYLYAAFDTSAAGAYASVERMTAGAWPLAGLARSLHRYASDAFAVVLLVHLLREWARGRYAGVRRFAWLTGIALVWLAFAAGVGGFWLVWDRLAQFSAIATTEWLDALPFFAEPLARNFDAGVHVTDRLFSLFVFLHIGLPLLLLALMWVHVQRLALPATWPPRALWTGALAALVLLSLARPVASAAPADLSSVPQALALDWFYLAPHALHYATSPQALWAVTLAGTLALAALPWLGRAARVSRAPAATVDLANCNGCGRCAADCPFNAIALVPRTDGRALPRQVAVDAALCAGCGICAGACPSSTPFRRGAALFTGVDVRTRPIGALRDELEAKLAGYPSIVVFACREAGHAAVTAQDAATIELLCAAQLPPAFVEYALRAGARGVVVAGCGDGDCAWRLGQRWTDERLAGARAPALRASVDRARVRVVWARPDARGARALHDAIDAVRAAGAEVSRPVAGIPKRIEEHDGRAN